jgi:two-component sensor histidine kinase
VRGVLSLQARATDHPDTKAALTAAASRIMTVADVHQHLYQGHSTAEIHVGRYVEDLAKDLATSLIGPESKRHIHARAADVVWPSEKATTLGLIITELVTNAIKYGAGDVSITFSIGEDGDGELVVEDQGNGFPEDFSLGKGAGLGSRLVTSLIREEEGAISIDRSVPHGRVVLAFRAGWRSVARNE